MLDVEVLLSGLLQSAEKNPVLLVSLLLGIGSLLGSVRIKGLSLGPAAVLFLAIALSAINANLVLPILVGNIGLALFAYTIGVTAGPSFFASLKKGSHIIIFTAVALVAAGLLSVLLGHLFDLPKSVMAGVYAGALTNTPALAAANEQVGGQGPIVGYSLTYIFGVLGMLAITTYVARSKTPVTDVLQEEERQANIITRNVRVEKEKLPNLGALEDRFDNKLVFSRILHGNTPTTQGKVSIATEHTEPVQGDVLTIVGEQECVNTAIEYLGHVSTIALQLDRRYLDFRRMTLSNSKLSGKRISQLGLERKYGATITRVRRGDIDLLATDDLVVLTGDRLRVVAQEKQLKSLSEYL